MRSGVDARRSSGSSDPTRSSYTGVAGMAQPPRASSEPSSSLAPNDTANLGGHGPLDGRVGPDVYNHLVMNSAALDDVFAALADPTRRAILARLASGETSVMDLAEPFAMSQPAISKHLKVLERAGLVSRRREAQRRPCRLEGKPLAQASGWLESYREFWEKSYLSLDAVLEELKVEKKKRGGKRR